jgi:hypothetical protein
MFPSQFEFSYQPLPADLLGVCSRRFYFYLQLFPTYRAYYSLRVDPFRGIVHRSVCFNVLPSCWKLEVLLQHNKKKLKDNGILHERYLCNKLD